MSKFNNVDVRVKEVLEQFPETRENDQKLYAVYIEAYYFLEFSKKVFINYTDYNLPPYSTIERSAREIKDKYPNLEGTNSNKKRRKKAEKEYIDYYTKGEAI